MFNESLTFAVGNSVLGFLLVAGRDERICAILLGDDPEILVSDLKHCFPGSDLRRCDADMEQRLAEVVAFIETPSRDLSLPLDVQGTPFQLKVWQALREVPVGSRVSYSDLARRIGMPTAVRAVAGACAANMIALAIPCHRVVRKDGEISGYRWGPERKRALLEREGRAR